MESMRVNYISYNEAYSHNNYGHTREEEEVAVESIHPPEKCQQCYFFYRTPKAGMNRRRFTEGYYFTCKKNNCWLFHRKIVNDSYLWNYADYRPPPNVKHFPNVILMKATIGKYLNRGSRFQRRYFEREFFGKILQKKDCPGFLDRGITIQKILDGMADPLGKIKRLTKSTRAKLLAQFPQVVNSEGFITLL